MSRAYLDVPFSEKDNAKSLGAKWDAKARKWYVPEGGEVSRFSRWLPSTEWIRRDLDALTHDGPHSPVPDSVHTENVTVFAPLYLVESSALCWRCKRLTKVVALAAAQVLCDGWRRGDVTVLSNVRSLPAPFADLMVQVWPQYHPDYSKQAGGRYLMNHCDRCKAKLGDFFLHDEPGAAFFPTDARSARAIRLRPLPIQVSFSLEADVTDSSPNLIDKYASRV
jgi:hypothetical protein